MSNHKNTFIEILLQHTFLALQSPPQKIIFNPDYLPIGANEDLDSLLNTLI
ncbi:hypothetical protein EXN66_Car008750 [Channa argus]|uniref:Uncharacterized protein n=1 Tax=Channa argus TaxID=215402 RepID=A0A6G1PSG1_CHAAH|nr:hypothetical protein EXN66_Car008750 [Channa argus]